MHSDDKPSFLAAFNEHGCKDTNALRWTAKYIKKMSQEKSRSRSLWEDMYTRPQVLQFNGLSMNDFKDEAKAVEVADQLVRDSMLKIGYEGKEDVTPRMRSSES